MRPLAIGSISLALACLVSQATAFGHESTARRTVVAQAEDGQLTVLVTWTAPTGPTGTMLVASAAATKGTSDKLSVLKELMVRRAVAPLRIAIDGKVLAFSNIASKLKLDRGPLGRHTVAVLATITIPPSAKRIRIANGSNEPTRMTWSDRTTKATSVSSEVQPTSWTHGPLLTLAWLKR